MTFPPQAYIVGAQKAGTTTLASLLAQHPDLALSTPKEPDFYTHHWTRGLAWYRGRFDRAAKVLLDASTTYAMAPIHGGAPRPGDPPWGAVVPARMHGLRPDARLIYLLRPPADRAYSAYWHTVRYGVERRPFRQAIKENANYLATSTYSRQIALFRAFFPGDQFLYIDFRDLARAPAAVRRRCLDFLGLDDARCRPPLERPLNRSHQLNGIGRLAHACLGETGIAAAAATVRRLAPDAVIDAARRLVSRPVPPMPADDRAFLDDYFAAEIPLVREMTGIDLGKAYGGPPPCR